MEIMNSEVSRASGEKSDKLFYPSIDEPIDDQQLSDELLGDELSRC